MSDKQLRVLRKKDTIDEPDELLPKNELFFYLQIQMVNRQKNVTNQTTAKYTALN